MEIFKLSDEVSERDSSNDLLTVTDLKSGIKNPNRVNVSINGKYAFSLDVSQVVDFKLKIGKVITHEELSDYKRASEFGKAYQRALEWVLVRPRSEWELRDYLRRRDAKNEAMERKKEWQKEREIQEAISRGDELVRRKRRTRDAKKYDFSEEIVRRLIEKGYVDDRKFAEYYVQNRFVKKGVSKKRLAMELFSKGVSREISDEVLNQRDDDDEIEKIIKRKSSKYDEEKLIQYLCRQGFPYELVKEKVRNYGRD